MIKNLDDAGAGEAITIYHAGTAHDTGGRLVASGGRVLSVTAKAQDAKTARNEAYEAVDKIDWPEGFCRRDIAKNAL